MHAKIRDPAAWVRQELIRGNTERLRHDHVPPAREALL
jgi:hypothetical protein